MNNIVIIPARLGSERFPNKLLTAYQDKIILQHSIDNAKLTEYPVVLASEDDMLKSIADQNGIEFFKCSAQCGTERAYKYYQEHPEYDNYITIPADEPSIQYKELSSWVARAVVTSCITTAYCDFFCYSDLISPKSCKIVSAINDQVLYFSRAMVPLSKDGTTVNLSAYKKHVGLFCFPVTAFEENLWSKKTILDSIESLEQNRFIELGISVKALKINHKGFGIDTLDQIAALEKRMTE